MENEAIIVKMENLFVYQNSWIGPLHCFTLEETCFKVDILRNLASQIGFLAKVSSEGLQKYYDIYHLLSEETVEKYHKQVSLDY